MEIQKDWISCWKSYSPGRFTPIKTVLQSLPPLKRNSMVDWKCACNFFEDNALLFGNQERELSIC